MTLKVDELEKIKNKMNRLIESIKEKWENENYFSGNLDVKDYIDIEYSLDKLDLFIEYEYGDKQDKIFGNIKSIKSIRHKKSLFEKNRFIFYTHKRLNLTKINLSQNIVGFVNPSGEFIRSTKIFLVSDDKNDFSHLSAIFETPLYYLKKKGYFIAELLGMENNRLNTQYKRKNGELTEINIIPNGIKPFKDKIKVIRTLDDQGIPDKKFIHPGYKYSDDIKDELYEDFFLDNKDVDVYKFINIIPFLELNKKKD